MGMVTLTIDGKEVKAEEGTTILRAALDAGIYIPNLCALRYIKLPVGACRLCVVLIEGRKGPVGSCTEPVSEGMVVYTNAPELTTLRRRLLRTILNNHPSACLTCDRIERCSPFDVCLRHVSVTERCVTCPKNGRCELQKLVDYIGLDEPPSPGTYKGLPVERDNPLIIRDSNLCVLCGRCVWACQEVIGAGAINFTGKGREAMVAPIGASLADSGCRFCGSCVEVCPTGALMDRGEEWKPWTDREAALVPCRHTCPAEIDVPRFIRLIAEGKFAEALAVIREKVPFPGVLGYICLHPCEAVCRRGKLNEPIAVKALERFAAEHGGELWKQGAKKASETGKRVAVVGSGPAGLTAAYYLAKLGHKVTVFEALPEPGGMMRAGIPEFKLPRKVISAEIEEIKHLGVEIKTNSRIESLDELFEQGYQAIFLALGAGQDAKLGVEGEELTGVIGCLSFLREVNLGKEVKLGDRVAVVGDNNAAVDAARTAIRLGAKEVTIISGRAQSEMRASTDGLRQATEEGIKTLFSTSLERLTRKDGALQAEFVQMPGKGTKFSLEFDAVIIAVNQMPEIPGQFNLQIEEGNLLKVNPETLATSREGVFAGGDVVTGPTSVIDAIAAGRKAAVEIDKYLGGEGMIAEALIPVEEPNLHLGREENFASWPRVQMSCLPVEERVKSFREVELGFDEQAAVREASRCLRCDLRFRLDSMFPLKMPEGKAAELVSVKTGEEKG